MNFWTAMVAIAGIMGIVAITRYKMELRNKPDPDAGAEQAEHVRHLEERVKTLERIVTDDKESLKRRIEEL